MTNNPLSPARDEENRRLAEFVGWKLLRGSWHRPECKQTAEDSSTKADKCHPYEIPDFFSDEAANALLLEAMPSATLSLETLHARRWSCWPLGLWLTPDTMRGSDPDRKTAIVKAALYYLEAQK